MVTVTAINPWVIYGAIGFMALCIAIIAVAVSCGKKAAQWTAVISVAVLVLGGLIYYSATYESHSDKVLRELREFNAAAKAELDARDAARRAEQQQ